MRLCEGEIRSVAGERVAAAPAGWAGALRDPVADGLLQERGIRSVPRPQVLDASSGQLTPLAALTVLPVLGAWSQRESLSQLSEVL